MKHYAVNVAGKFGKFECLKQLLAYNDLGSQHWPNKPDGWTINHFAVNIAGNFGKSECLQQLLALDDLGDQALAEVIEEIISRKLSGGQETRYTQIAR